MVEVNNNHVETSWLTDGNVLMPDTEEDWEFETVRPMRIGVPARDVTGIG